MRRNFLPSNGMALAVLLLAVFACGFGSLLFGKVNQFSAAQQERQRIENEALARKLEIDVQQKSTLSQWIIAAKVAGGALALASVAGGVFILLRWLDRRASEIRADSAGLFPVVRIQVDGVTALHDPNRSVTPITVYAPERLARQVTIYSLPSGDSGTQERTTARAQLVQAVAAQNRHAPILAGGKAAQAASAPLPAGEAAESAPWPWPSRVPLSGLLNGSGASLHRLVLGVSVNQETGANEVVTGDMSKLVHVAVGGSSGWGKSVFLRSLAYQLAICPERPDLALVDLEGVTFSPFANSGRLLYPIADNEADALAVFQALTDELDRRKALFAEHKGVDSLDMYNSESLDPLSPIVALTDEATALLADKSVESALRTLALRGRKFGLWLTLGGQDWRASSLDSAIRNQLAARVQFKALSASQSRVLLQQKGAEELDTPGRALAVLPGRGLLQFQAPMISLDDILAAMVGDGPQRGMPNGDDASQDEMIRQLAVDGLSKRAIQERVFGYTGGAAYSAVSRVLDGE